MKILQCLAMLSFCYSLAAIGGTHHVPAKVEVVKNGQQFGLTLNGQPYAIHGVGLGFKNKAQVVALKSAGGNTFRTWSMKNIEQELAIAEELGLMIAVGIETGKELQGFDYNDKAAVEKQFKRVTAAIDKYKNHPNILLWVIANEPNLVFDKDGKSIEPNPKVYDAMSDIIDYIHQHDPNHPVTYTLAGANKKTIELVLQRSPQIDILSVQLYGDLANLSQYIAAVDADKPFMVTEFGPMGHWEMPSTSWGREIEEPSGTKAAGMARRMLQNITNDPSGKVIGSFAFYWGQKQERTPTWYGMINESGEYTARIDELSRIWTGHYPANRAPLATAISINGLSPTANLKLRSRQKAQVKVQVFDPDGDALTTRWEIMQEVNERSQGGHFEATPQTIPIAITNSVIRQDSVEMEFSVPSEPGEYRLFNYSYDGHNHVANANFPFLVEN